MALSVSSAASTSGDAMNTWMDFYVKHRNDNGPIQALFNRNLQTMGRTTADHLGDTNALTETIVGTAYGNMMMLPGRTGTMHIVHHGFGAATDDGFSLNFAQGNLEDCTVFKSISRTEVVAQIGNPTRTRSGGNIDCPTLEDMMGAETEEEFTALAANGKESSRTDPTMHSLLPRSFSWLGEHARCPPKHWQSS